MNGQRDSRDLGRGRGRGRGRGGGLNNNISRVSSSSLSSHSHPGGLHSTSIHSSSDGIGRGRGRGRGRGISRTMPAWMKDDRLKIQDKGRPQEEVKSVKNSTSTSTRTMEMKPSNSRNKSPRGKEHKPEKVINFDPELSNSAALNEVDEKNQREREERELERLAAQFADSDEDETMQIGDVDAFETEEEKEARLAKERREKRKLRMKLANEKISENQKRDTENRPAKKQKIHNDNSSDEMNLPILVNPHDKHTINVEYENMGKVEKEHGESVGDSNIDVKGSKDGADSFDMFSSSVSPPVQGGKKTLTSAGTGLDDAEGYYRATVGEVISFSTPSNLGEETSKLPPVSFRVHGIIGKGVFSTVLKCTRIPGSGSQSEQKLQNADTNVIAMKLIRSNDTMAKAAQKEVHILRMLKRSNGSESNIVKMYELDDFQEADLLALRQRHDEDQHQPLLEYHNHTTLLFEHLPFNLRECLSKFGKNVGINLSAIRSYAKQLLTALQHLALHRIVHADIKLDNILVSSNFSVVKICDFGSAFFETDSDNDPTPYLVSRFYRAPEVQLGLEYDHKIDLWSVAVSLAELFTGNVLFAGRSNNDMLKKIMQSIGPFSNKMIRRHINSFTKLGLEPHFETVAEGVSNYNFRRQDIDKVTGRPVIRIISASSPPTSSLQISQILLKSRSASDGRGEVLKFGEFLSRCLALDPTKRIKVEDATTHEFFISKKKVKEVEQSS